MTKRFRVLLSAGAFLFGVADMDKNAARANECADQLRELTMTVRSTASRGLPVVAGRLSEFVQAMGPTDTVALKLTFAGARSTYLRARQKLKQNNAHFIQEGLQEFTPLKSFWQSPKLNPWGTGRLDIRVTKDEMLALRPFIELADGIEPVDAIGREDDQHILRGDSSFESRIDLHQIKYWSWMNIQSNRVIRVQTVVSYDKAKFKAIVAKIDQDDNGVRVVHSLFDPLLSIGYLSLEATVQDLKQVVESTPEIHLVHVSSSLNAADET